MSKKVNIGIMAILGVLFVPAVWALFHPGFFPTDDGNWMIIRFSAFYEALRQGEFPVRFLPRLNHGYGYPVADFLYPGFMYLGVVIHILGAGFVSTIKIILGVSIIGSGIFSYLWLRKQFNWLGALTGSLTYVYFPYYLWDIYHRGSVGEVLALSVVPFIFWQFEINKKIVPTLGIAFLVLAHNTLALLFLPVIVCYLFFVKRETIIFIINTLLYALGVSAFFWVPALYDKQYTVFDTISVSNPANYFVTDANLIGLGCVIAFFLSFWVLFKKANHMLYFFLIVLCISLFLSSSFSHIAWDNGLLTKFVQFPFRFLSIAVLASSFISASVVSYFTKWRQWFLAVLLIGISLYNLSYIVPKAYQEYPDGFYTTNEDSTTVKNEYMPKWVKEVPTQSPTTPFEIIGGQGMISLRSDKKVKFEALVTSDKRTTVQINTIYFPGWLTKLDSKLTTLSYNNPRGLMRVSVPAGSHLLTAVFSETPIRLFADVLSLTSILMLLFYRQLIVQFIPIFQPKKKK